MTEKSAAMPLVEALLKYKAENIYPMHTPGHKGGRGMEPLLRQELGGSVAMDVSLMSELDDIHEPETYIKTSQRLAAQTYGSDACFFAVNGTTQAIHAMLLTALNPGDKLLLPRNAHRSVVGALILGGIKAVYMQPEYHKELGLQMQVTSRAVQRALAANPGIKAVLLTSPNYYGVAADIEAIAEICHLYGAFLLVDEAHGPHLGFCEDLPPSAMQCGADACAQSTHKLLGAATQCSMLHVQGKRLDIQRAADIMSVLTTTSPNYLLLASLDAARAQVQARGREMAEQAVKAADKLRRLVASFDGLRLLKEKDCGGLRLDRTKVTVNFFNWGCTGVDAGDALRRAGIAVELVDQHNVLFLVTYADNNEEYDAALERIKQTLQMLERRKAKPIKIGRTPRLPETETVLPARQVFYSKKRAVKLEQSAGLICGEQVSFYPPGIPVLLPGDKITKKVITYCRSMKNLGLPLSGPADSALATIRVVEEQEDDYE